MGRERPQQTVGLPVPDRPFKTPTTERRKRQWIFACGPSGYSAYCGLWSDCCLWSMASLRSWTSHTSRPTRLSSCSRSILASKDYWSWLAVYSSHWVYSLASLALSSRVTWRSLISWCTDREVSSHCSTVASWPSSTASCFCTSRSPAEVRGVSISGGPHVAQPSRPRQISSGGDHR